MSSGLWNWWWRDCCYILTKRLYIYTERYCIYVKDWEMKTYHSVYIKNIALLF